MFEDEARAIVETARAGVVAGSDGPEELAAAILTLLRSPQLRKELGENARRAAVERYDWRARSDGLADEVLGR
jgi:glycosyltransferase involved in cell wall biosynthesis